MATVLMGGSNVFDSLAYSKPHPSTQTFLQNQLSIGTNLLNDAGSKFMESAQNIFEKVSGSEAIRIAKAASRVVNNIWNTNQIRKLNTIGELQNAPQVMERYIMAEPTIRKLYHNQMCDGYSHSYVDLEPNKIGESHYDYRRVMNGIVVDTDDGGWYANSYFDDMLPEDEELMMEEQVDIITAWEKVKEHIKIGKEDPTSKWNSDL